MARACVSLAGPLVHSCCERPKRKAFMVSPPLQWLQSPYQNSTRHRRFTCNDIEEPMNAIVEVDVAVPGRPKHNTCSLGWTPSITAAMTGQIRLPKVTISLCFYDSTRYSHPIQLPDQHLSKKPLGHDPAILCKKSSGKLHTGLILADLAHRSNQSCRTI